MICLDTCFTDKNSAATHNSSITIGPYVEILLTFMALQAHIHIFNYSTPLGSREKKRAQEYFRWLWFISYPSVRSKKYRCGLSHFDGTTAEKRQPCNNRRNGK